MSASGPFVSHPVRIPFFGLRWRRVWLVPSPWCFEVPERILFFGLQWRRARLVPSLSCLPLFVVGELRDDVLPLFVVGVQDV